MLPLSTSVFTTCFAQLGASLTCGGAEPISISSQDDLDFYSDCDTLISAIEFSSNLTGDITLDGVLLIGGRLSIEDTGISSFTAPDLANASDIRITNNANLNKLNFTNLHSVYGDLSVSDNEKLEQLHFQGLLVISQDVNLTGAFTDISFGDRLQGIDGDLTASSTKNLDCGPLDTLNDDGIIQGSFSCIANSDSSSSSPSPTPTSESNPAYPTIQSDNSSSNHNIAWIIGIGVGFGVPLFAALIIGALWLMRRRQRKRAAVASEKGTHRTPESDETHSNGINSQAPLEVEDTDRYAHEMGVDTGVSELPPNKSALAAELDSRGGISELPAQEVERAKSP
ncbi:hypothetical protein ASPCAL10469 [Aspergillus calidoustus]|uniref:Receptor L-domain domain-containing protein n=1 Tax=Aspergillus calidoustus TaxID=454130 RepID=A0A0U5CCB7_ASPCI|nr:hypothetical protein ASPCAL10469 [Aspergillus calidoustus]